MSFPRFYALPFPRRILVVGLSLIASACAQHPQRPAAAPAAATTAAPAAKQAEAAPSGAKEAAPPAAAAAKAAEAEASLPKQELTEETLYEYLLAEIAGQRGALGLSAQAYVDLAKRTRDPRIARRAAASTSSSIAAQMAAPAC